MPTKKDSATTSSSVVDLISRKRDGHQLSTSEITSWVDQLLAGQVSDAQLGAWLMAVYIKGLTARETEDLTTAMTNTGQVMTWPQEWKPLLVDKHSTGGVGDKVSLVLAPALAACGKKVPMISGRGLGITGGTLDKLESIPGYRVALTADDIFNLLDNVGCCIAGQTGKIAPSDKIMYACRDQTATVGNLSLQTSSIVSKKASESISALVLDIKYGKGCYQPTLEYANRVANSLVRVSRGMGIRTTAVISAMDNPLGKAIGNSLEVAEAIDCLQGKGPKDLEELVVTQGSLLLACPDGEEQIRQVLRSGEALDKFADMIKFQGVDETVAQELCKGDMWKVLPKSMHSTNLTCPRSGWIGHSDALVLGKICVHLGAGRSSGNDKIDHGVGIQLEKVVGDKVEQGDTWAVVYHATRALDKQMLDQLHAAIEIQDEPHEMTSKIAKVLAEDCCIEDTS